MTLYVIGLGLYDAQDITLRGLHAVKKCSRVYFEMYTSRLHCPIEDLALLYGKEIIPAGRDFVERQLPQLLNDAKNEDIALLVVGTPLAATTHIEILVEAKKKNVPVQWIENASILTAIGITGLSLYKFGRVATIPFSDKNITSPIENLHANQKQKLHTLFLLDIEGERLMTVKEGLRYLIKNGMPPGQLCIGCGGLGGPNAQIKAAKANELQELPFTSFPQCLIVPGKLHFKEEEALQLYY